MRRFFDAGIGMTLEELAAVCGAELRGEGNVRLLTLATLEEARASDLSFFDNPRYASLLPACAAGALIVPTRHLLLMPSDMPLLVVKDAQRALALAGQALFPSALAPEPIVTREGVSGQAFVDPSASIEAGAIIEPMAVVGPDAEIGRGTVVGCGAVVGPCCSIGRDCRIGPHASIQYALLGNRVILHPGVRLGQDGFGYATGRFGILKMVQVGRVIIQDDVEIGANTTVDRGAIRDTVIGENTKIDNQVQIAHNVRIGRNCIIVSQVGISGSVTIGDGVAIGGQTGINGHVTIGNGAQIAAVSTVAGDVPPGARWGGMPARPVREWFREMAMLRNMAKAGRSSGGDDGRRDEDA